MNAAMTLRARWARLVEERHVSWTWRVLETLYTEPHRIYHNLEHIAACFALLEGEGAPEAHRGVELAVFLHDAVYVPGDSRNELLSATLLRSFEPVLALNEAVIEDAYVAVLATRSHEAFNGTARLVVDVDMAILGASRHWEYPQYVRRIRREFASVSDEAWRVERMQFLAGMLAREGSIYQTPWGLERFEKNARGNMSTELACLEQHAPMTTWCGCACAGCNANAGDGHCYDVARECVARPT